MIKNGVIIKDFYRQQEWTVSFICNVDEIYYEEKYYHIGRFFRGALLGSLRNRLPYSSSFQSYTDIFV